MSKELEKELEVDETEAIKDSVETEESPQEEIENSTEESTETQSEESADTEEKGGKFFKKKGKTEKKQEKDKMKEKVDELEDKVKRQMAEFDNFRKRTEKEKASMFEMGAKSVVEKMLPVIDNFERGLAAIPEDNADSPFAEGMNMIYKQLMEQMNAIGVKPIEAVGVEFNPDFHNAVMQVESDEFESGIIAQELQKGYIYRETVVRHSMVAVVQ